MNKNPRNNKNIQTMDKSILNLLVCPISKTPLIINKDRTELISLTAHIAFPINNGVPLLTIEESRDLTDEEYLSLK